MSDEGLEVGRAYGAAYPPEHPYAQYGSARRVTFLVDPDGTVARSYEVDDVATHPDEVLEDLRRLRAAS